MENCKPGKNHETSYIVGTLMNIAEKSKRWWAVLKSLVIMHILMREGGKHVKDEMMSHLGKRRELTPIDFIDKSSLEAQEFSSFCRVYANYISQKLHAVKEIGFDVNDEATDRHSALHDMEPKQLTEKLPVLQDLMRRLIECVPAGHTGSNPIVHSALVMTVRESFKLYRCAPRRSRKCSHE